MSRQSDSNRRPADYKFFGYGALNSRSPFSGGEVHNANAELWFCIKGGEDINHAATWAKVQLGETYTAEQ